MIYKALTSIKNQFKNMIWSCHSPERNLTLPMRYIPSTRPGTALQTSSRTWTHRCSIGFSGWVFFSGWPHNASNHWCSHSQNLTAKASNLKAKAWTFEAKTLGLRPRPLSIWPEQNVHNII